LFGHLIGVMVLISAVVMTVTGLLRAQRARTTSQIRVAMGGVPLADRLIPPAMLLVLGFGLYMVSRHGSDGSIRWDAGWVDVSLAIFTVMAVLGPAVEVKRAKQLWSAACAATDEVITDEMDRLRRDPLLAHVSMFGSCQLVVFLYLMSNKPALPGSLAAVAVAALVSVVLTRVALLAAASSAGVSTLGAPSPALPASRPWRWRPAPAVRTVTSGRVWVRPGAPSYERSARGRHGA